MKRKIWVFLFFFSAVGLNESAWAIEKDPRIAPISKSELISSAASPDLTFSDKINLLSRADWWNLELESYEIFKELAHRTPKDGSQQLLYAIAARRYAQYIFQERKGVNDLENYDRLVPEIREQFRIALEKNPKDVYANLTFGFWLWKLDSDMPRGLTMVRKALEIDPQNVSVLATLGEMFSSRSGNCYDQNEAKRVLEQAIELDPNYAYPRWTLTNLLSQQGLFEQAKQQFDAYVEIIPTSSTQSPAILEWQERINLEIQKKLAK